MRERNRAEMLVEVEQLHDEIKEYMRGDEFLRVADYRAALPTFTNDQIRQIFKARPDAAEVAPRAVFERLGRRLADDQEPVIVINGVELFDIGQTEGDTRTVLATTLTGKAPARLYQALATYARQRLGFTVVATKTGLDGMVNGETRYLDRKIVINANNDPAMKAKTLIHEIGHALMHRRQPDRRRAEIEAETFAAVVGAHFGLDTRPYTVGYVAQWAGTIDDLINAPDRVEVAGWAVEVIAAIEFWLWDNE